MCKHYMKLHVLAFGFAFGIVGAISMFIVGIFAMGGHGVDYVNLLSSVYVGYKATLLGSFLGAIWGFVDCFIFGIILAAIYNGISCCCCRRHCSHEKSAETDKPHEER